MYHVESQLRVIEKSDFVSNPNELKKHKKSLNFHILETFSITILTITIYHLYNNRDIKFKIQVCYMISIE